MNRAHRLARSDTLTRIKRDLDSLELALAAPLRENMRHHYQHLQQLAETLETLGLDEQVIGDHVVEIFNRYRMVLRSIVEAQ